MDSYTKSYQVRWSDLDANGHVNYAAFIDATADLRYHFFSEHGFPRERFVQMGVGPIYTSIQAHFLREVLYGETVTITWFMAGLSPSGLRFRVHHDVLKANGKKAVDITLEGTLLDMTTRKPVRPSAELLGVFELLPRAKEFEVMPEGRWGG